MNLTTVSQQQQKECDRQDPYMRLVYAIGILLTMFRQLHSWPGELERGRHRTGDLLLDLLKGYPPPVLLYFVTA